MIRRNTEPSASGIIGEEQLKNIGAYWSDGGDFQEVVE